MSKDAPKKYLRPQDEVSLVGHGGNFGRYMENKTKKLRVQFQNEELSRFNVTEPRTEIFHSICIFVNGYTTPSHQELKTLMAQHGGGFETYLNCPPVTHFICENLPLAKIKQLKKERQDLRNFSRTHVLHLDIQSL